MTDENSKPAGNHDTLVVHPSPVFLVGPLVMAVALVAGGVARGILFPRHSTPALLLLALTFLFSRWFRRSAIVFDGDAILLGGRTIHIDDIAKVAVEKRPGSAMGAVGLSIRDKNGVERIRINSLAYGAGVMRLLGSLRARLGDEVVSSVSETSLLRRVRILWIAFGLLSVLSLIEGFAV